MKEIKFRIWDIELKIFHYWNITESYPICLAKKYIEKDSEQYTGQKDKNNKEIYKGDVVNVKDDVYTENYGRLIREVKFKNGMVCINDESYSEGFRALYWYDDIQVIGNIHENPKLKE